STQDISRVGHHISQVIDRSLMPKDVVMHSVHLPLIKDDSDIWDCEIKLNNAILELARHGGGPVHINLTTSYSRSFEIKELPRVRIINRITQSDVYPPLPDGRIAVFIGSHAKMSKELTTAIDSFCESHDAVVFCDHTSGYKGKYRVLHSLSSSQRMSESNDLRPDLTIHLGEITGDYSASKIIGKEVWRVNEDGELRDTFRKLKYVFEMPEKIFFEYYKKGNKRADHYLNTCRVEIARLYNIIPELPFSNLWIAKRIHKLVPENSVMHFGILNSLRSWNFFELPETVESYANVGGFGIDGCVSTLIGASLSSKDRLYFGVVGDLAFFYDMNSIGNRHVGNNLRILLINNGTGTEFKNFNHMAAAFGKTADEYIAAAGHFGNKSKTLIKNYSKDLGFEYLSASSKDEFEQVCERFLSGEILGKPILFEVFTNSEDESKALEMITSLNTSVKSKAKETIRNFVGEKNVSKIKKIFGK
ncbi:MAG: 2-succinyl-5-enolpyruvyl-6-hydroxy-3-cyclohexene-1-carboxylate synthase, partial [Candidatus Methanofastidiosa archaeon]|nr:2-succinyl-5-enolpyruvyl-6-hydroxy-3-cyclohexene-1-carboxylate synthase [Candidatus Methanofastidiosa archaeon]